MRSKLLHPGRFIRTTPLIGKWASFADDPACALCRRASCAPAWLHVERRVFVCDRCMGDPWQNGEAVAARLPAVAS